MGVELHALGAPQERRRSQEIAVILQRIGPAETCGPPVLSDRDERRLKDLQRACRAGDFNEVQCLQLLQFPRLLVAPDRCGCTLLHHGVMSGNPGFVAKLLSVYRDRRTFEQRHIVLASQAELMDHNFGLRLCVGPWPARNAGAADSVGSPTRSPCRERMVFVSGVGSSGLAREAGVLPGDILEGSDFIWRVPMSSELRPRQCPSSEEVMWARHEDCALTLPSWAFPLRLRFSRPAHASILASDSWRCIDLSAGKRDMGTKFRQIYRLLIEEKRALSARPEPLRERPPLRAEDLVDKRGRSTITRTQSAPQVAPAVLGAAPPPKVLAGPRALEHIAPVAGPPRPTQSARQEARLPPIVVSSRIARSAPRRSLSEGSLTRHRGRHR